MTSLPNISKNRLRFTDDENKVLVTDLSALVDSAPINNAPADLSENTIVAGHVTQDALAKLQSPMPGVTDRLNSGEAASEMLASIQSSVPASLPSLRASSASIAAVCASGEKYSTQMSKSVLGTLNTALSQVPGAIGRFDQISAGVKASLLKTSVGDFANSLSTKARDWGASASTFLKSADSLQQGLSQAARSIQAAKQSFDSLAQGPLAPVFKRYTLSHLHAQTLADRITNAQSGGYSPQVGTTSDLLDVCPTDVSAYPDTQAPLEISYNTSALTLLFAGVTWYKALYATLFTQELASLMQTFGSAQDHYTVLSQSATDLQAEQLRNFEALVTANTPDNPTKSLFVCQRYQEVLAEVQADLANLSSSKGQAILAYLGQFLVASPIKSLMTSTDYDSLAASLKALVYSAQTNSYALEPQSDYRSTYQEAFAQLVTDALVYHRGSAQEIPKRAHASSEIALFCYVWAARSLMQAYLSASDLAQRTQLGLALEAINTVELQNLTCVYTDFHELVRAGDWVYWYGAPQGLSELTYPLLKYYLLHRDDLQQAKASLVSAQELAAFDALTLRLDALLESGLPEVDAIRSDTSSFATGDLSEAQLSAGSALVDAVIHERRMVLDASLFPEQTFELYVTPIWHLYLDSDVAFMR